MARDARRSIWICCCLLPLSLSALFSQDRSPRTINIKVAADTKFCIQAGWHSRASKEIRKSFIHLDGRFGIQFKIKDFIYWSPKSPQNTLTHFLNDLRKNSGRDGCDMVIGIISPERLIGGPFGIASYFDGYILVADLKPRYSLEFLITHELCHMFGAIDLKEKGSIMSMQEASYQFDEFTRKIILLQKHRGFNPALFPLSTNTLDESIDQFKKRSESRLDEPGIYFRLAILCSEKKDYASAQTACFSLLKSNPDFVGLHSILGSIYLSQNENDKAIEELLKELAICPDLPEIHCNLGLAYDKKGRINEAVKQYNLALELDPNYAKAHADLGSLYLREGAIDQAISECRMALKSCPEISEALCTLAAALVLKHEPVISSEPLAAWQGGSPGLGSTPKAQEVTEALEEAVELCKKAISLKADISGSHNILGVMYVLQNNYQEAEEEFLKSLEINSDSLLAHFNLGLLYFSSGRTEKATYHLKKILDLDPSSDLGQWILAQVFQGQKSCSVVLNTLKKTT